MYLGDGWSDDLFFYNSDKLKEMPRVLLSVFFVIFGNENAYPSLATGRHFGE